MAGGKTAVKSKGADRLLRGGAKALVGNFVGINCVTELQKAGLNVLDGCSLHSRCDRFHERTPFGVPIRTIETHVG